MNRADFILPPCVDCVECREAGVNGWERRRDPHTGRVLHGYELAKWHADYQRTMAKARAAVGAKGRHVKGFVKLVGE